MWSCIRFELLFLSGIKGRLEFLNFVKPFTNDCALPHFLVEVIGYQACGIKVQMY